MTQLVGFVSGGAARGSCLASSCLAHCTHTNGCALSIWGEHDFLGESCGQIVHVFVKAFFCIVKPLCTDAQQEMDCCTSRRSVVTVQDPCPAEANAEGRR